MRSKLKAILIPALWILLGAGLGALAMRSMPPAEPIQHPSVMAPPPLPPPVETAVLQAPPEPAVEPTETVEADPEPEPAPEPGPEETCTPEPPRQPVVDHRPHYFGFLVDSLQAAVSQPAEPKPRPAVKPAATARVVPKPKPRPKPRSAPVPVVYVLMEGRSAAGFDGDSSLHKFSGSTTAVTGEISFMKGRIEETAAGFVALDVAKLDTGHEGRDQVMHEEHLETEKYPEMRFTLRSIKLDTPGFGTTKMTLSGTMKIHGVEQSVTIPGEMVLRKDGYLYARGKYGDDMTRYGITPPSKLGIINVDPKIDIWFEFWAAPRRSAK